MKRREFLNWSGLISASATVPQFMKGQTPMFQQLKAEGKKLIVIQWSGGNDGLNTVIPTRNDLYYKARPAIGIQRADALNLNSEWSIHPQLEALKELYDQGDLKIIQGVGYPEPNRSHFRSMEIWHSASGSNEFLPTGWVGRYLDQQAKGFAHPYSAISFGNNLNPSLKGRGVSGLAVTDPGNLHQIIQDPFMQSVGKHKDHQAEHHHDQIAYLHQTLNEARSSVEYVYEKSKIQSSGLIYPATKLGRQLKNIGQLVRAGSATQVYYAEMSGFDTHAGQPAAQKRLFTEYSNALKVLVQDLKQSGEWNNTVIMTFSEFGRRVEQNAARGTDHGKANLLFLAGGDLKSPGISNTFAGLEKLDNGDLQWTVDFRSVYGSIIQHHFHTSTQGIIGADVNIQQWI